MNNSLKQHLLTAPESQLDPAMRKYIEAEWQAEPSALQILEVLDKCIHFGLASGLVIMLLESMLNAAVQRERTDMAALEARATWRAEWS